MAVTGSDLARAYLLVLAVMLCGVCVAFFYWRFLFRTGKPVFFASSSFGGSGKTNNGQSTQFTRTRLYATGAEVESESDEEGEDERETDDLYAPLDASCV